jgi:uncharacterized protein (TIGR00255 family)
MIISMTGFGRGEATENGFNATVELKTLNSKFLDVSMRLPQQLQHKELELKEVFQKSIKRGKLNVNVNFSEKDNLDSRFEIDFDKVKSYTKILNKVREVAGISKLLTIKDITNFSDIFISKEESEQAVEVKWKLVLKATEIAILKLMQMRQQEGEQLKNDLITRVSNIQASVAQILILTEGRSDEVRRKLKERIRQLIEEENIDKERLELEVVLLADKMDITEETVRLVAHLKFFLEAIEQPEPAGRRLNFLTQEINRELNTIGSKANDSKIAHHVVRAKEMLEQIREQIQNVE